MNMITINFTIEELEQVLDALGALQMTKDDLNPAALDAGENKMIEAMMNYTAGIVDDSHNLSENVIRMGYPEDGI